MPAAVILPWNDPLRVVEKTAMLDILSEGRVILGMGRGAARREFNGFRKDLADSRELFDEAALIIMDGLETGTSRPIPSTSSSPHVKSARARKNWSARPHADGLDVALLGRGRRRLRPQGPALQPGRLVARDARDQRLPQPSRQARPQGAALHHQRLRRLRRHQGRGGEYTDSISPSSSTRWPTTTNGASEHFKRTAVLRDLCRAGRSR